MKKIFSLGIMIMMLISVVTVFADDKVDLLASNTADYELVNSGFIYSRDYNTDDEMYSINVKAVNNTTSNIKCDVIAVVYNENGVIKVVEKQEQTIYHESSNKLIFNLATNMNNSGKGEIIKVFLWEKGTVKPLCLPLTIDTQQNE